jgi:nucleoside-diphosphate-sugar epimerase
VKVLLTGHRGRLGPSIAQRLLADGYAVQGFDLLDGADVMDALAVVHAARGCDVIVHVAGLAGDRKAAPADVVAVNLIGTANILFAAEAQGVRRVVYLSSGRALGLLERDPDYLPLDDDHRGLPSQPYALAKWLAEEMCAASTRRTGMETICLRPVAVFDDDDYARALRHSNQATGQFWALGVHLNVRDLADAVAASVRCPPIGHTRILLCAADVADRRRTLDLVATYMPHIPWRGGSEYASDPYRSLVDISRARRILDWQPRHTWPGRAAAAELTSAGGSRA